MQRHGRAAALCDPPRPRQGEPDPPLERLRSASLSLQTGAPTPPPPLLAVVLAVAGRARAGAVGADAMAERQLVPSSDVRAQRRRGMGREFGERLLRGDAVRPQHLAEQRREWLSQPSVASGAAKGRVPHVAGEWVVALAEHREGMRAVIDLPLPLLS